MTSKEPLHKMDCKVCTRCTAVKPLTEFYKNKYARDGLATRCRYCHREQVDRYRKSDKGKANIKRYLQSDKRKAFIKRWRQSNK